MIFIIIIIKILIVACTIIGGAGFKKLIIPFTSQIHAFRNAAI